jgi:membrane protein DedA with SNARE-associated domain
MVDFLLSSHGLFAYLLVFGVLLASSLGAPIPEDLTLIVAGIMSSHETVQTGLMALTCYLGILAGDLIIYRIGWLAGPALFRKQWFRKHLTTRRLQLIRENLDRRTILTILVARHLFYIRTATFLMCGAVRLPFARFFLIDACAALITVPLMMGLGYLFAHNYSEILGFMRQLKVALLVLGIIAAVLIVWRFKRNKHRTHEANPSIESEDAPEG